MRDLTKSIVAGGRKVRFVCIFGNMSD
jgi:hypothetical protein